MSEGQPERRITGRNSYYMDVFCNPVASQYSKSLDPGSKTCRDDRYTDSMYIKL